MIGLSKNLFYYIKERFYLGYKVIIDLDENTITYEEENEVFFLIFMFFDCFLFREF